MRTILLALLVLSPALAGCMQGDDAPAAADAPAVAASKTDAGAVGGPAPAAPKEAYKVQATDGEAGEATETVAHPLALRTNAARDPVEVTLEGVFAPQDCTGVGLFPATDTNRWFDLREHLEEGDVFAYDLQLAYENAEDSWAEVHMSYGIGTTIASHSEPTQETRGPVLINFTGQGYRVDEDDAAWANVYCWYGQTSQPVPFTLTVRFTFAEDAVPAETPILVTVPEGATKLLVTGVPLDPSKGVNSHYRLFGPDDALVCECGLGSLSEASFVALDEPGDYVILVDHTANGFVALALDAPPAAELEPLDTEWAMPKVLASAGEANVDAAVELDLPRVPLFMSAWSRPEGSETTLGGGKKVVVEVTNPRGTPLRVAWGGFVNHRLVTPATWTEQWWGVWPADWSYANDHHAYDLGKHQVRVQAEALRGDVYVLVRQYER